MKKPNAEERRSLMAVHLPETLKSKRIQSLVGRFVDDEGELGLRSTAPGTARRSWAWIWPSPG